MKTLTKKQEKQIEQIIAETKTIFGCLNHTENDIYTKIQNLPVIRISTRMLHQNLQDVRYALAKLENIKESYVCMQKSIEQLFNNYAKVNIILKSIDKIMSVSSFFYSITDNKKIENEIEDIDKPNIIEKFIQYKFDIMALLTKQYKLNKNILQKYIPANVYNLKAKDNYSMQQYKKFKNKIKKENDKVLKERYFVINELDKYIKGIRQNMVDDLAALDNQGMALLENIEKIADEIYRINKETVIDLNYRTGHYTKKPNELDTATKPVCWFSTDILKQPKEN